MNVLFTGANGFLGSHVLRTLVKKKYKICILIRESSDLSRIDDLLDSLDICFYKDLSKLKFKAQLVIHFAWQGVSSNDRDNFEIQIQNLTITQKILDYCKTNEIDRIIAIGSQAEYGFYNKVVDEKYSEDFKTSSYGTIKNLTRFFIEKFCNQNNIKWTWLRLFSFYGPNEDPNWFIPWLISNIKTEKKINMTEGEQRYAYMYVDDFSSLFIKIIESPKTYNNIYNICSENDMSLREITFLLKDLIKPNSFNINFGAIPYRKDQIMLLKGSVSKLLNHLDLTTLNESSMKKNLTFILKELKNDI